MNIVIQTYYTPHLDPSTFDHRIDAIKNTVAATMIRLMASRDVANILESANIPKIEEEKD